MVSIRLGFQVNGKKIYTRPESQSTSPMYLGAHNLVLKFEPMVWSPVKNKIKKLICNVVCKLNQ